MPKKKTTVPRNDVGRTGLMLRFDDAVFAGIKKLAEESCITVNQLMQGLARWAIENGRSGEPYNNEAGKLCERTQPGCVWFGTPAVFHSSDEREELAAQLGGKPDDYEWSFGRQFFKLDYTERSVVKDLSESDGEKGAGRSVGAKTAGSKVRRG